MKTPLKLGGQKLTLVFILFFIRPDSFWAIIRADFLVWPVNKNGFILKIFIQRGRFGVHIKKPNPPRNVNKPNRPTVISVFTCYLVSAKK
jgi:hypothetical protein